MTILLANVNLHLKFHSPMSLAGFGTFIGKLQLCFRQEQKKVRFYIYHLNTNNQFEFILNNTSKTVESAKQEC